MFVRMADESDCEAVFDWRNDPHSQKMSFESKNVTYEEHVEWFEKSLKNPSRFLYVGEFEEGERIGICRFDFNEDTSSTELSINMNPRLRGKGLGKHFLLAAIDCYEMERDTVLSARIKIENEGIKKIFAHAGFTVSQEDDVAIVVERPMSHITFREVEASDVDILYELLLNREHSISHQTMPKYDNHKKFVLSNPYESWYLINDGNKIIGSFYIQSDNSIGINISSPTMKVIRDLVGFIENNFSPKSAIASKVPSYFYFNVAKSNVRLAQMLDKIGCEPIQVSYKFPAKGTSSTAS